MFYNLLLGQVIIYWNILKGWLFFPAYYTGNDLYFLNFSNFYQNKLNRDGIALMHYCGFPEDKSN